MTDRPDRNTLPKPALRQRWESLLFAHWRLPARELAPRLPPGLEPLAHDGDAWVGVVPFAMRKVRPRWAPPVPWLSGFLELNVRTYVRDASGAEGVWFFSLDANQPVAVELARRWYHLNYRHAEMAMAEPTPGEIRYRCLRRGQTETARFAYPRAGDAAREAAPGSLEFFLLERYALYAWNPKRRHLLRAEVAHAPYRFEPVSGVEVSAAPLRWEGIDTGGDPPAHLAVAHPVDVDAARPAALPAAP